jgi:stage II sporulation protein M
MNNKQYFLSLKKFILISFLIFVFGIASGYFFSQASPDQADLILADFQKTFEPVLKMSFFGQFLFVLLNNSLTVFLVIVLSFLFGVFPLLVLFSNGFVLGLIAYFFKTNFSLAVFFLGIVPHGIVEIPIIILASAVGFRIAQSFYFKLFKKTVSLSQEFDLAFNFFLKILFPLLILAAFIEIFITSYLLK